MKAAVEEYTAWQRTFLRAVRGPMDVTDSLLLQLYDSIQAENHALVITVKATS
jgi:ribosomal protein S28E/S33